MNYIWCGMIIISFVCAVINGRIDETMAAAFSGAENAVKVLLSFGGMMCFWSGIIKVAENGGICTALKKMLSPLVNFLFKNESEYAKELISINISANMLGVGNAATPMGIKAMNELQKSNKTKSKPSRSMCLLMVLNTTCFTVIPSSVISIRAAAGSSNPGAVLLPVWIVSVISVIIAVSAVFIFVRD